MQKKTKDKCKCDKCGKVISKLDVNVIQKKNYKRYSNDPELFRYNPYKTISMFSYCNDCFELFLDNINDFNNKGEEMKETDKVQFEKITKLIEDWMKNEEKCGRQITSNRAPILALYLCSRLDDKEEK